MDNLKLSSQIEAVLFYKNEPMTIKKLCQLLEQDEGAIRSALAELKESLSGRGVTLVTLNDEVSLTTSKDASPIIEKIAKDELSKEIGKAGLETLAIILYNNGASRREIDYIRGVNSTFILRNLSIRGLVLKVPHPKDPRGFLYKPSIDLLAHLGIASLEQLPEFESFQSKLNAVHESQKTEINE
jgi:segregation and condensation protein B